MPALRLHDLPGLPQRANILQRYETSTSRTRRSARFFPALPTACIVLIVLDAASAIGSQASELPKPTTLVPGVRIDWVAGAVELDAKVVLRKGPLELFACSPQTREHESILVTKAKPTHVFQAMGLVGLQPGSPVAYDEEKKKWLAPTGEKLRVSIMCNSGGGYVPARTWVIDPKTKVSPETMSWVFAGSSTLPDGRFLADLDGTIICLVDFESALITVAALHTADNSSLWLEANTNAIPPVETPCIIRIENQDPRIIAVLGANGELTRNSRPLAAETLAAELKARRDSTAMLVILCDQGVSKALIDSLRAELVAAGVDPSRLSIRRLAETAPNGK